MNLRPAPQDLAAWLPDALEVMERNSYRATPDDRAQAVARKRPTTVATRSGEAWSDEEDLRLIAKVMRGIPRDVIARELKRPVYSVYKRTCVLRQEGAL